MKPIVYLRRIAPGLTVATVFAFCAGRLFLIVDRYAVNILVGDQWKFDEATIFQEHSWLEIFRWQHGPHRQGLGAVLAKLIEPLTHWNSRYESLAIWGVLCLACLAALWLKTRLFGKLGYADVIIPLLFLSPVQHEVLLGGTSPSHGPLPLLLVVLSCLAWTVEATRWKYGLVLALNFILIYTGFGLFIGLITPVLMALEFYRQRKPVAMVACLISLLSLGSFFVGYQPNTAAGCSTSLQNPIQYFLFVAFMLARFIGIHVSHTLVLAILAGSLLALAMMLTTGIFIVQEIKVPSLQRLTVSVLLSFSLLFSFTTAYGRICLGLGAAQGSRYMTYLVLGFFGLYLAALCTKVRIERNTLIGLILGLVLLSSARIGNADRATIQRNSQQRQQWKQCYLRSHNIKACDAESGIYIYWMPEPDDLQVKLDYLEKHRLNLFADSP